MKVEEFNKIKKSKEKYFLHQLVMSLDGWETEYRFHPIRRWRFDWANPDKKVAIEYEGIFSRKSRHTTISGFTKDTEKYNEAAKLGWTVLRYTAMSYKNAEEDLKELM